MLYVRNLTQDCTEERLKESFESFGKVERVKKIKDYAFVHFEDRDQALKVFFSLSLKIHFFWCNLLIKINGNV